MNYRALIFDFDGTIADTLEEALKIYNTMATSEGLKSLDESELPFLRTLSLPKLLEHLDISKLQVPKLLFQGTRLLKERIPHLSINKGMKEALTQLHENAEHFGILTSNSVENATLFLKTHGLENLFDFVISTSKLTGKSRYLKRILKEHQLQPQEMIYIGDETRDIISAKKAGVRVAAVTFGFNAKEALEKEKPDFLCDTAEELVTAIS